MLQAPHSQRDPTGVHGENDWGSGGRELNPAIAGIVCINRVKIATLLSSFPNRSRPRRRSRPRPLCTAVGWPRFGGQVLSWEPERESRSATRSIQAQASVR